MNGRMFSFQASILIAGLAIAGTAPAQIPDTGQSACYDGDGRLISCPAPGEPFYGQDGQIHGNEPRYTDNGDGTISDLVTGLMWQQGYAPDKLTYDEALDYARSMSDQRMAGYSDWRLPTITQLYSLMDFRGQDPPPESSGTSGLTPFIDTTVFDFAYGDTSAGERIIDSQWVTTSLYTADDSMMFGVNFADGRIKAYPRDDMGGMMGQKTYYVRLCRGNDGYGAPHLVDNGDGTVTDEAAGLMWQQTDSGSGMTWERALAWVEDRNSESFLGHEDWRLPNAKELQSLVDYSRSPDTTSSPAIDPIFQTSSITNEDGRLDFPFFWTGTTHVSSDGTGANAVYIAFGRGLGYMNSSFVDIHGAGCQRSDPKLGNAADYPQWGWGPQGDVRRVFNYVRLVRDASAETAADEPFVYWIELAANLEGLNDTEWLTDLVLRNLSAFDASITVTLHGDNGTRSLSSSVPASSQAVFEDVVDLLGMRGKGCLEIGSDQQLAALARVYNQTDSGTLGQLIEARSTSDGLTAGESAWLYGLRQFDGSYRTNLSVTNTGDAPAAVSIDLYASDSALLHRYDLEIEPSRVVQDLQPFASRAGRTSLGWGFARVQVNSGTGILCSASVIDSKTGDPTSIAMHR